MSQEAVYKLLKKKDKWMGTEEISKKLDTSRSCIIHSLSKLYRWGEILKKEERINGHLFYFWRAK